MKDLKDLFRKFAALTMCLLLTFSMASCDYTNGQDAPLEEQENLIEESWTDEQEDADSDLYYSELETLQDVTEQVQNLSMDLFREGMTDGGNGMISPVSILMAMAMVENGAAGESLAQLEEAFGCDAESLSSWLKAWKEIQRNSKYTRVNIANSFWFRDSQSLKVKEEYLKNISSQLNAQAYRSAFNQSTVDQMNKWVDENTYGMIDRITERIDPENMTVLLNATAFEGAWAEPYEDFQVRQGEFFYHEDGSKATASLMYSREGTYIENKLMTGFKKPYKDGYSFVALLPKEGRNVAECVEKLDGKAFRSLMEGARSEKVDAVIPEFTSRYTLTNLVEIFEDMSITDIFSPAKADLSKMAEVSGENLHVTEILQKTFIEVNRTGTRAAAVTEIKCGTTAFAPEEIYEVRLDRPFIYAIVDDSANIPMFIGTTMYLDSPAE